MRSVAQYNLCSTALFVHVNVPSGCDKLSKQIGKMLFCTIAAYQSDYGHAELGHADLLVLGVDA